MPHFVLNWCIDTVSWNAIGKGHLLHGVLLITGPDKPLRPWTPVGRVLSGLSGMCYGSLWQIRHKLLLPYRRQFHTPKTTRFWFQQYRNVPDSDIAPVTQPNNPRVSLSHARP